MDRKTLRALIGTIEKWEGIVAGTIKDKGVDNCPLCKLFHTHNCKDCPVASRTGFGWCIGTPYAAYCRAEHWHGRDHELTKAAAKKELEFLESLLPPTISED